MHFYFCRYAKLKDNNYILLFQMPRLVELIHDIIASIFLLFFVGLEKWKGKILNAFCNSKIVRHPLYNFLSYHTIGSFDFISTLKYVINSRYQFCHLLFSCCWLTKKNQKLWIDRTKTKNCGKGLLKLL